MLEQAKQFFDIDKIKSLPQDAYYRLGMLTSDLMRKVTAALIGTADAIKQSASLLETFGNASLSTAEEVNITAIIIGEIGDEINLTSNWIKYVVDELTPINETFALIAPNIIDGLELVPNSSIRMKNYSASMKQFGGLIGTIADLIEQQTGPIGTITNTTGATADVVGAIGQAVDLKQAVDALINLTVENIGVVAELTTRFAGIFRTMAEALGLFKDSIERANPSRNRGYLYHDEPFQQNVETQSDTDDDDDVGNVISGFAKSAHTEVAFESTADWEPPPLYQLTLPAAAENIEAIAQLAMFSAQYRVGTFTVLNQSQLKKVTECLRISLGTLHIYEP
jgi:hypothetical protein